MANMDYCKFENTLGDLRQCYESEDMWDDSDLNQWERPARKHLINLCIEIASEFGDNETED
jgi:hypothetical protein